MHTHSLPPVAISSQDQPLPSIDPAPIKISMITTFPHNQQWLSLQILPTPIKVPYPLDPAHPTIKVPMGWLFRMIVWGWLVDLNNSSYIIELIRKCWEFLKHQTHTHTHTDTLVIHAPIQYSKPLFNIANHSVQLAGSYN